MVFLPFFFTFFLLPFLCVCLTRHGNHELDNVFVKVDQAMTGFLKDVLGGGAMMLKLLPLALRLRSENDKMD